MLLGAKSRQLFSKDTLHAFTKLLLLTRSAWSRLSSQVADKPTREKRRQVDDQTRLELVDQETVVFEVNRVELLVVRNIADLAVFRHVGNHDVVSAVNMMQCRHEGLAQLSQTPDHQNPRHFRRLFDLIQP